MEEYMKKLFIMVVAAAAMVLAFSTASFAQTYSENWYEDAKGWHIKDGSGNLIRDAWVCDDAGSGNKNTWYLIDGNGDMISAALVQDGTGNYYSLETSHNGYYGMLRYQKTTDNGIELSFDQNHNGSFAAILDAGAVQKMIERYGVKNVSHINNDNIVYTSSFAKNAGSNASAAKAIDPSGKVIADKVGDITEQGFRDLMKTAASKGWTLEQDPYFEPADYFYLVTAVLHRNGQTLKASYNSRGYATYLFTPESAKFEESGSIVDSAILNTILD